MQQRKFRFWPVWIKLFYLCPEGELHEGAGLFWGVWNLYKRDKVILPPDALMKIALAIRPIQAGPTDKEGKPVVQ